MEIKTKYNRGDTVYFMYSNAINSAEITKISIEVYEDLGVEYINKLYYSPYFSGWMKEEDLFESGEAIINKLSKSIK